MNLSHVFEQGDPVLITVFLLLAGMSIASWYLIFWKSWNVRRERNLLANFHRNVDKAPDWPRHNVQQVPGNVGLLIKERDKLKSVVGTYKQLERKEILSMHMAQTLDGVRTSLEKGLTLLASVGTSAPFIGLFGTVWGIYGALTKISAEGNASLNVVAGPMGEALVATAIGLFAAIPAVLAYNMFLRQNRLLMQDLRHIAEQLTTYSVIEPLTQQDIIDAVKVIQGGR